MTPPTISVAMATYNGGRFLREQLRSIGAQTRLPDELVISDDRSTDDTLEIAHDFAANAPFPVVVHRNETTLRYARNFRAAASHCTGDVIAFTDQDDWWDPNRLERSAGCFDDPEVLLTYHNARLVDDHRQPFGVLYEAAAEREALRLKPVAPWHHTYGLVQMFRADLRRFDDLWDSSLNEIIAPMDIMSHDQWYVFLAQALGRVEFLDECLVDYRQHSSNTVGASQMRPTIEKRLLARLEHHGSQDDRNAQAASARATILREIADREPRHAPRLEDIAQHYERLAARHRNRFATYSAKGMPRRAGNLVRSWFGGDYRDWPWGFDPRSVVRDLWSGVLLSRL